MSANRPATYGTITLNHEMRTAVSKPFILYPVATSPVMGLRPIGKQRTNQSANQINLGSLTIASRAPRRHCPEELRALPRGPVR